MAEKKLLILDLDETLISANEVPLEHPADFRVAQYHVYRRPILQQFLLQCTEWFDLAVWTSSSPAYAVQVVREIFPNPAELHFLWASDRCTPFVDLEMGEIIPRKKLTKVKRRGYSLESVIIVDDTLQKLRDSYGNLVAVKPFFGDSDDRELELLLPYLEYLRTVQNVRMIEKRSWRSEQRS